MPLIGCVERQGLGVEEQDRRKAKKKRKREQQQDQQVKERYERFTKDRFLQRKVPVFQPRTAQHQSLLYKRIPNTRAGEVKW